MQAEHMTTIIDILLEDLNTFSEDLQDMQDPVAAVPISRLCNFFDPIADHVHSVE